MFNIYIIIAKQISRNVLFNGLFVDVFSEIISLNPNCIFVKKKLFNEL